MNQTIAAAIAALEEQRAKIAQAIDTLRALDGHAAPTPPPAAAAPAPRFFTRPAASLL